MRFWRDFYSSEMTSLYAKHVPLYMHEYSITRHILGMCMYVSSPQVRETSAVLRGGIVRLSVLSFAVLLSLHLSPIPNLPGVHTRIPNYTERIGPVRRDGPRRQLGGGAAVRSRAYLSAVNSPG